MTVSATSETQARRRGLSLPRRRARRLLGHDDLIARPEIARHDLGVGVIVEADRHRHADGTAVAEHPQAAD